MDTQILESVESYVLRITLQIYGAVKFFFVLLHECFCNFSTLLTDATFLDFARQLNEPSSRIAITNCGRNFEKQFALSPVVCVAFRVTFS